MGHPILCGRARNTRLPFDLSLVFITLGEPQAHGDTAEAVPFQTEFSRRLSRPDCRIYSQQVAACSPAP